GTAMTIRRSGSNGRSRLRSSATVTAMRRLSTLGAIVPSTLAGLAATEPARMSLEQLKSREECSEFGARAYDLVRELFPICRSITGDGVRRTLDLVAARIPLQRYEVPSGTQVFDWQVPPEWNIRDAYVKDSGGRRVIDFQQSNLHVVSYSVPVRQTMSLTQLRPHLHSIPEHPDWIPYRTSYYKPAWGFCVRDRDLRSLREDRYEVCIDSTLAPGSLTYAECYLPGASSSEVLVFTHVCHPSLAND